MSTQQNSPNTRQLFLSLPVANLENSKQFFTKLGFEFNSQFTDEKAACMIVNESAFVMLLAKPFFQTFTKNAICDTSTHSEVAIGVPCSSRAEVDRLLDVAVESGGRPAMPAVDHGFMYSKSFYDLDSHHWELVWMNHAQAQ